MLESRDKGGGSGRREVEERSSPAYGPKILASAVDLWRALKNMTKGEARQIVKSVREQDGFVAWQKLAERYEQGREARTGIALAELGDLVKRPAKNPKETKALITELDRRMKEVFDVAGVRKVGHMQYPSLDTQTGRQNAPCRASRRPCCNT